jgi:hypothetical protein
MKRRRIAATLLIAAACTAGFATTKFYDVVPHGNCIAETPQNTPIQQSIRNVVDSLNAISIWVGDRGNGNAYDVEVQDSATSDRIAWASGIVPERSWYWMPCTLQTDVGAKPVRGRTYNVIVTRQGGAEISYAYNPNSPYAYDCLSVSGTAYLNAV